MKNKITKVKSTLLITFLILIVACSENSNKLNIELVDAKGLKEGAKVLCKNVEIGKVENIFFVKRRLYAQLIIDKEFKIPKESKVYLISEDIFGTKAISIELSDNNSIYTELDTVKCIIKTETIIDTTIQNINRAVQEIKDSLIKIE